MALSAREKAESFIRDESQFHLGMLPTEQSNPKTRRLSDAFPENPSQGVRMLQSVDRDIIPMLERVTTSPEFQSLVSICCEALRTKRTITFSGCGATGRLSILLESMWRQFFIQLKEEGKGDYGVVNQLEHQVKSIMTGGDYALVRSVENFEDYAEFGRQQVREAGISRGDVLIGITEGGETSSVLGTIQEAKKRGASTYILFNNPRDILCKHIERSRDVIEDPEVTVLDLHCGAMALTGSTRMQATTAEMLVAGMALEQVLQVTLEGHALTLTDRRPCSLNINHVTNLLRQLERPESVTTMARYIGMEVDVYQQNGLITYFADRHLLDIFTDTTERAPTFMLPPFTPHDDTTSPPSWAFVKHPCYPTATAWQCVLGRPPRCLQWTTEIYHALGAPRSMIDKPPQLDDGRLKMFHIGNEHDRTRLSQPNAAIAVYTGKEHDSPAFDAFSKAYLSAAAPFDRALQLQIGSPRRETADYYIPCSPPSTNLRLLDHIAVKLVLNTISTGTMACLGRVDGNWMTWVEATNKKLIDRSTRLIAELAAVPYRNACVALFQAMDEIRASSWQQVERPSPVQYALRKIKNNALQYEEA